MLETFDLYVSNLPEHPQEALLAMGMEVVLIKD